MKNFIIIFLCTFLNLSAAFALELDENDNNKVFEVTKGEKISIRLNANATTGYNWHFEIADDEKHLVKILKEKYVVNSHPAGMVGVGGKAVYKFKTLHAGKLTIIARYYRPWESFNPEDDKELKFTVEIR